jgi:predicted DNA-binding protein (UPF0251 family)
LKQVVVSSMPGSTIRVTVEVPAGTPAASREVAEKWAHEAAVLALWDTEQLSTREAAEELGLSYRDFLDLLAAQGLPVVRGPFDMEALEAARRKLAEGRS